MFGRAIRDKLPECIFEIFQKSQEWFIPKIALTEYVVTGQSLQTNKHFVLKRISFNSRQLQNNSVDGAMLITINRVIKK